MSLAPRTNLVMKNNKYPPMKTSRLTLFLIALAVANCLAQEQPQNRGGYPVIYAPVPFEHTGRIVKWSGKSEEQKRADYDENRNLTEAWIQPTATVPIGDNDLGGDFLVASEHLADWQDSNAAKIFDAVLKDKSQSLAVVMFSGWGAYRKFNGNSYYLTHQFVELLKARRMPLIFVCPWDQPNMIENKYELELMRRTGGVITTPERLKDVLASLAVQRMKNPPDLTYQPEAMFPPVAVPPVPADLPARQDPAKGIQVLQTVKLPSVPFSDKYNPAKLAQKKKP